MRRFSVVACFGFALLFANSAAFAQANVPSSADAGRVEQQMPTLRSDSLVDGVAGVTAVGVQSAPSGAQNVKLTLKEVVIADASAYDTTELSEVYAHQIGQTITLADVYGIAERLTAKYRNDGYVLTQVIVPPQTIDGGTVRLRVVEGFVDQVRFQGQTRGDMSFLAPFADKIRASKPLNSATLERYLLIMNDMAGMQARAVLSPSPTVAGATDITLVVDQRAFNLFSQIDNRGSRYLGQLQANAGVRFNNMLGLYEGINIQGASAPDGWPGRELDYVGINWQQPLNHEGTRLTLGGSITATQPGYTLEQFDVEGLARSLTAEVYHPFIRSRNKNLFGTLRFNWLNSERNDNTGLGEIDDHLRVVRAGGTWQFTDRFVGINTFNTEVSKGLDIMGASDKGDTGLSRAAGDPQFFKATAEISRLQRLNNRFDVFGSVIGQKSANKLLASEEFGVGGVSYGSAYDSSEITGEDGLAARAELRVNDPVVTPLQQLQVYGFYDVGRVWDRDNTVVRNRIRSLSSSGAGLRFTVNENISGNFEVAVPLTRDVETSGDTDPRAFGGLTARF